MEIRGLSSALEESYSSFLLTQPDALLYHSLPYSRLLSGMCGAKPENLVAVDSAQNIVGALPLMSVEGEFGKVYNSLPFYGSNGGILGKDPAVTQALIECYNNLVERPGVASATLVANPLADVNYSELACNRSDRRIGQFTPLAHLENPEEKIWESYHYKTRNMVRKATKTGVEVEVDNSQLAFLEEIHKENMASIGGKAKPESFFSLILRHFQADHDYRIFIARIAGEPVAALLVFYFNKTVEYFTPVVRHDYRDSQALSLIIHTALCNAAREGYSWWNWGGTWVTQEGVYRFKKRWGTEDKPYEYYCAVRNPALDSVDPRRLVDMYPHFYVRPFNSIT